MAGPAPALVQLELSPYNQRPAEVAWARGNRAVVTCAAWSKLSGAYNWGSRRLQDALINMQGPRRDEGPDFGAVGAPARVRAPAAVRRVDSVQRLAIAQNALAGVEDGATKGGQLSAHRCLNQLEDRLASGRLGRAYGWTADQDVTGVDGLGPDDLRRLKNAAL